VADKDRKDKKKKRVRSKTASQPKKASEKKKSGAAPESTGAVLALTPELVDGGGKNRLDQIKQSHALLRQFSQKELKLLMNLKRNTSPKAWTLREDLVVLSIPKSNREIAEILKGRNKEAVKKRLQLLRSKGLTKRSRD